MTSPQLVPDAMKRHWGWLLALGVLFILLGSIGLGMTVGLTLMSMLFFGVLLCIGGVFQLVDSAKSKQWRGVVCHALIGILYLIAGVLVMYDPFLASTLLTGLLGGMLIFIGVTRLLMGFSLRHTKEWGYLFLAGILSIGLGLLILMQWPWSGLWVIGLFIAIELMMSGWMYVFIAVAMRQGGR